MWRVKYYFLNFLVGYTRKIVFWDAKFARVLFLLDLDFYKLQPWVYYRFSFAVHK